MELLSFTLGDNKKYYFIKTGVNPLFTRVY